MADEIDASVQRMEAPALEAVLDRPRRQAGVEQLMAADDAVLSCRDPARRIDRHNVALGPLSPRAVTLATTIGHYVDASSSRRAGET